MYRIDKSSVEEFMELTQTSFEDVEATKECYDGYEFDKLSFFEEPLVIIGWVPIMDLRTNEEELYMCCAVSVKAVKHLRALVTAGHEFVDFMAAQAPLCVVCEKGNNTFGKFVEHFGFKKTNFVEKNEESGIIYDVYIRRQV